MGLVWCVCPGCGNGFMGHSPGEPCSSGCRGKLIRQSQSGPSVKTTVTRKGEPIPEPDPRKGMGQAKGGNCLVLAVALAGGAAAVVAGAAELVRHII